MNKKLNIENNFFDILAFLSSFFISFIRSIKLIFIGNIKNKNIFFDFLDFIFRKWTKYFWKNPSLYKLFSFFGDSLNFIFKTK